MQLNSNEVIKLEKTLNNFLFAIQNNLKKNKRINSNQILNELEKLNSNNLNSFSCLLSLNRTAFINPQNKELRRYSISALNGLDSITLFVFWLTAFISFSFNRLFEYCSLNPLDDKKALNEESIYLSSLTKLENIIEQY